ncbi:PAN2-PAN3 deadenylation complex subunit PAN3 isoform X1 [Schistocerca americana]|uniref:PAN2-PAN3 deadenylation complex subunit PAN3 isoform X1 n=2 Tax=Schistocerca americana TaxID=7009 RepID=UPI001F500919|nr:PAN2-PAN3 deadenylation complex subunit PAN3 isoform X1 [Schistocerca americana]
MDGISSSVRKPAVSVNTRVNYTNSGITPSNLSICYTDENLILPRNPNVASVVFHGSVAYTDTRVKAQDVSYTSCDERLDSSLFLSYSQANGVPQESKLATYMNRQSASTPTIATAHAITKGLAGLTIEQTVSTKKVTPQAPEFIPAASTGGTVSPNFLRAFSSPVNNFVRRTSVESPLPLTPHLTPQPSPPLSNCSPTSSLEKTSVTPVSAYQENVGGTTYFYPASGGENSSLNSSGLSLNSNTSVSSVVLPSFHMYPGTPTHLHPVPQSKAGSGYYIAEELRLEALHRNALVLSQPDPDQYPDLPNEIDNYHDLCPLQSATGNTLRKSQLLGYPISTYKATNTKTGVRYCLRRVHGFRLLNTKSMVMIDMWKRLQHSNIVQLREVFTTKAFGDYSMIFVYDYHPGAETMMVKHFTQVEPVNGYCDPFSADPSAPRPYSHQKNALLRQQLPENVIWNYIMQLTSALRVIHSAGLACRTLDPTKILLTGRSRLRLSCLAIADVLSFDPTATNPLHLIPHYQQEDLTALGKLVLALGCRSLMAIQRENIQTSLDLVTRTYSSDLRNLIMYLLSSQQQQQQPRNVTDLMPMIGARFYTQLDAAQMRADILENELAKEMENGRLCRLLVKLGTVNERPELNMDPTWAETGDRYMLKLFRDYLYHQVTEDGRPWIDMAHVVHCLNKLDAGVHDKICLMSRDEQSVLVVSYAELKHCLEQSFDEILAAAATVPTSATVATAAKPDPVS